MDGVIKFNYIELSKKMRCSIVSFTSAYNLYNIILWISYSITA